MCIASLHLQPTCILYVDESVDKICNFPCSEDNCVTETHHFILCPAWSCYDKSSTTMFPTVSPANKTSPCSTPLCISSVTVNVLIVLVTFVLALIFLKRRRENRNRQARDLIPLFESGFEPFSNENPIIRSAERLPLLSLSNDGAFFSERSASSSNVPDPSSHAASVHQRDSSVSLNVPIPRSGLHFDETTF